MSGTLASLKIMLGMDASGVASGAASAKKTVSGLTKASNWATGIAGAAVGDFMYTSMDAFVKFDDGMRQIFTLLPDMSQKAMGDMKTQVRDLAKEFGVTTDQVIPGMYDALSSGIPQEAIGSFMRTSQQMAVAGVASTQDAVGLLSQLKNAYGLDVSDMAGISDDLFQAVNKGVTTIPELAASLSGVTPQASAMGVSIKEVLAGLVSMTLQGMSTGEAVTNMNATLTALQKPLPALAAGLLEAGYASGQAAIDALGWQGAMELVNEISKKTGLTLPQLTGRIQATNAVLSVTGSKAADAHQQLENMNDTAGLTKKAFDIMQSGVGGAARRMVSAIGDISISLGEMLQPVAPLMMAFGPQMGRMLGRGIGAGLALSMKGLGGIIQRAAPQLIESLTQLGVEAGGGLGKGMMKSLTASLVTSFKSAGWKKLVAGGIAMAAGVGLKSATEGSTNALVSAGGGLAGSLMTIAGAFAIGGPVLATVVAIEEAISKAIGVLDTVNQAQNELTDKVAKVAEQTGQEALKNMTALTAQMHDTQGLQRMVGDSLGGKQMMDALTEQAKAITNAETLTLQELDQAITTFGNAAIEATARGNTGVATELTSMIGTLQQMRGTAATAVDGLWHKIVEETQQGGQNAQVATTQAVAKVVRATEGIKAIRKRFDVEAVGIGDAWDTVSNALAGGPKIKSFKSRLRQFTKAISVTLARTRKAVRANDPVAAAEWAQRLIQARAAKKTYLETSTQTMVDARRIARMGEKKTTHEARKGSHDRIKIAHRTKKTVTQAAKTGAASVPAAIAAQVPATVSAGQNMGIAASAPLVANENNASGWGSHMGSNYASGIWSQVANVTSASDALARAASSRLAFSHPPRKGPLSKIRSWGPHMVMEWLRPIHKSYKDVEKVGHNLGKKITPKPGLDWKSGGHGGKMPNWGGGGSVLRGASIGGDVHIHIGTLIADDTGLDKLEKRMERRGRVRKRRHRENAY